MTRCSDFQIHWCTRSTPPTTAQFEHAEVVSSSKADPCPPPSVDAPPMLPGHGARTLSHRCGSHFSSSATSPQTDWRHRKIVIPLTGRSTRNKRAKRVTRRIHWRQRAHELIFFQSIHLLPSPLPRSHPHRLPLPQISVNRNSRLYPANDDPIGQRK